MRNKIKLLSLVLIVVFIFSFTACTTPKTAAETTIAKTTTAETTAESDTEKDEYNIGDAGPAGGLIFYVNPNYKTDGWRYLEVAPANLECIAWSNITDASAGASATAVGTGKANTTAIIGQSGHIASAAQLCNDLTVGGYSDWFLPSIDELGLIYENLYLKGFGGLDVFAAWSSSEYDASNARLQGFSNGGQGYGNKGRGDFGVVRAVRAF